LLLSLSPLTWIPSTTGVLLKTQTVETNDEEDLGALLVVLLVSGFVAVLTVLVFEIRELLAAVRQTGKLARILHTLPQQDPPDNTTAFYAIQIPVEASNTGDEFTPKSAAELSYLTTKEKLAVVKQLTTENERRCDHFFHKLSVDPAIPLQQVKSSLGVYGRGLVCAQSSQKSEESIIAKAKRPTILAKNPCFGIEHIRDTFRFKVRYI
jgi:hypothetical protein